MDNVKGKLVSETAATIYRCFDEYNDEFGRITRRAHRRFEEREWKLGQRDAVERIELYDQCAQKCIAGLVGLMGVAIADHATWSQVRSAYSRLIHDAVDNEFYKTFFNSLTRKVFNTVGVNSEVEFLAPDLEPALNGGAQPLLSLPITSGIVPVVREFIERFPSAGRIRDIDNSVEFVVTEISEFSSVRHAGFPLRRIEMLEPVFYRATRAFCVGRMHGEGWVAPLILAFMNTEEGIVIDAVMMHDIDARSLFGFARSYFHVDLPAVGAAVRYLSAVMPTKPIEELYTVLGRAKQGKTERYRRIYEYLRTATDEFVHADGQKGMVMIAFTLRDYGLIFKVIRDRFAPPKKTTRAEVMERYQFVFKHDRVGRLVDAQEFRRLRFPKTLFSATLLDELLAEAAATCRLEGSDLIIEHSYIERKLRPLNLYLAEASRADAQRAVVEYGQAIKDLARCNVFPGDLLLKNFGVTRAGRVVFYDYDELCLVTDCAFRDLPTSSFEEDEMRAEPWFYVGAADVFPEQFANFLGVSAELRETFMAEHAELLTADFWREIKACHEADQLLEVVPYADRTRFARFVIPA